MLIQYLVDPKASFGANNEPKYLTSYEANYEVKKLILATIVRQYIERESILTPKINRIYCIIWGQCTPGLKSVLKVNEDYPTKSNFFVKLRIIRETRNINAGIDVKPKKSDILYHTIWGFINMRQVENNPNDTFKLRFDNIFETVELAGGYNILHIKQLTKNGNQASMK